MTGGGFEPPDDPDEEEGAGAGVGVGTGVGAGVGVVVVTGATGAVTSAGAASVGSAGAVPCTAGDGFGFSAEATFRTAASCGSLPLPVSRTLGNESS